MSETASSPPPAIQEQVPAADVDEQPRPSPRSYILTVILAAVLWYYDTQFVGAPLMSMLVLTLGNLILVVRVLIACYRRHWRLALRRVASIGIYSAVCLVVVLQTKAAGRQVRQNAENLVAACEQYRAREGRYPEQLAQLVPRDIAVLPSARRGNFGDPNFRYYVTQPGTYLSIGPGVHVLEYTSMPPYGKTFYAFEKKSWSYRD